MARKPRDTEVDAYIFIKEHLGKLGWDIRNPDRVETGQVYTQNECLSHPEIGRLLGLERPENIVKIDDRTFWVIEGKRSHSLLGKALGEAEDYARRMNKSTVIQVRFISGVAGNYLDSFLIRTRYWDGSNFVAVKLNGVEASGLLFQAQLEHIMRTSNPDIEDPRVDEKLFLDTANRINEILHLGAVNPHRRAGVMATLLLSMLGDTDPNIAARSPSILIQDINTRALDVLRRQGKSEFASYVNIILPASPDNHMKFRRALVDTIQELNGLNIRSAMNSGADWLGAFYEVFLKYASWAQDLGIVLTPRHLTRYIPEVMAPDVNDILYDPTCGTGGFLVAALDYVKRKADKKQLDKFKQNCVFGIEQDAALAALAVVNMIFRADGKNNIREGNCFANFLAPATKKGIATARYVKTQSEDPPVSMVMMNPPFALKRSDEKEFKFVDYALAQMTHGGLLFSVLPYSAMVKPGAYKNWRCNSLLARNTLLAVVTFPIDLFYPIGVTTVGIFVKKGIPHPREQKVLWIRALNDGFVKSKKRRLPHPKTPDDLAEVKHTLKAFLRNPEHSVANVPKFQKACPIDFSDPLLELVPENYLDQAPPTKAEIQEGIERIVRDSVAFLIRARKEDD